jgi:hypothetical protein
MGTGIGMGKGEEGCRKSSEWRYNAKSHVSEAWKGRSECELFEEWRCIPTAEWLVGRLAIHKQRSIHTWW